MRLALVALAGLAGFTIIFAMTPSADDAMARCMETQSHNTCRNTLR